MSSSASKRYREYCRDHGPDRAALIVAIELVFQYTKSTLPNDIYTCSWKSLGDCIAASGLSATPVLTKVFRCVKDLKPFINMEICKSFVHTTSGKSAASLSQLAITNTPHDMITFGLLLLAGHGRFRIPEMCNITAQLGGRAICRAWAFASKRQYIFYTRNQHDATGLILSILYKRASHTLARHMQPFINNVL